MKKGFVIFSLAVMLLVSGACSSSNPNGWTAEQKSTLTYLIKIHDPWLSEEALESTVQAQMEERSYGEFMAELHLINND